MHELSICRALLRVVERHADGRRVLGVHVEVGRLRAVVPDTLSRCWDIVCLGTAAEGAPLLVRVSDGDDLVVTALDVEAD